MKERTTTPHQGVLVIQALQLRAQVAKTEVLQLEVHQVLLQIEALQTEAHQVLHQAEALQLEVHQVLPQVEALQLEAHQVLLPIGVLQIEVQDPQAAAQVQQAEDLPRVPARVLHQALKAQDVEIKNAYN